jgi:hypothetical protein
MSIGALSRFVYVPGPMVSNPESLILAPLTKVRNMGYAWIVANPYITPIFEFCPDGP